MTDPVYVRIERPEGYEDVCSELVIEDAIQHTAFTIADATAEVERLREALRPFVQPESYSADEVECRKNKEMDWCAVHSFRWPCPVAPARAALAGQEVERG